LLFVILVHLSKMVVRPKMQFQKLPLTNIFKNSRSKNNFKNFRFFEPSTIFNFPPTFGWSPIIPADVVWTFALRGDGGIESVLRCCKTFTTAELEKLRISKKTFFFFAAAIVSIVKKCVIVAELHAPHSSPSRCARCLHNCFRQSPRKFTRERSAHILALSWQRISVGLLVRGGQDGVGHWRVNCSNFSRKIVQNFCRHDNDVASFVFLRLNLH